jgi:hypothetical protein
MISFCNPIPYAPLSRHLNVAPSAAIVVTISLGFLAACLFAPGRGLFWRHWNPARLPADTESGA